MTSAEDMPGADSIVSLEKAAGARHPVPHLPSLDSHSFSDIASPLEEIRRGLIASAEVLIARGEGINEAVVRRALHILRELTCKVAVVGQVKAGKSLFIGAMIGRANMLPSDANPWTTVVTNLHLRHAETPSEEATFTFFSAGEWSRIANGGGPLRELTERLVPGFDGELLSAQLEAMRKRAEQRLGPRFESLLGQTHSFPTIDRSTLDRYVSAGPDDVREREGWYSDLTKSADLYLNAPRNGLPTTVVDTPGTNDPLLVRDEITRLNVARGDVFVVVLTAQQPLSTHDLALLRLLRGLNKDRIVVFLNRIDSLRDIAAESDRLVAHVSSRLQEEFPSTRIPVIPGSALWASIALGGSDAEVESQLGAGVRAFAAARGGPHLARLQAATPAEARAALLALSGMPEVNGAIARTMQRASAAHVLRQNGQLLFHIVQSSEATEIAEVRALRRALTDVTSSAEARDKELTAWRSELAQIESAGRQLQSNLEFYERALAAIVERCAADLRQLLGQSLERFIGEEVGDLETDWHDRRSRRWQSDPAPLRKELQREFLRVFGYWDGLLRNVDSEIFTSLQRVMPGLAADRPESPMIEPPSVSGLGRPLIFDLAAPWWRTWWSRDATLDGIRTRLVRLLREEFEPLIADFASAATDNLSERSEIAARQARLCTLDIVEGIRRRTSELIQQIESADKRASPELIARIEGDLRHAEGRAAVSSELRGRLATLLARANRMLEEAGVPPAS